MTQPMKSREDRILSPLLKFFSNEHNFKIFLDIVVFKTRNIPLRMFDWFVTNYTKKYDVTYTIKRPSGITERFSVHRNYIAQLRGCRKKEFDPFCRDVPITLEYESPIDGSKVVFETAACQLKFFKWAIENLIINYIEANYDAIYDDMKLHGSKSNKNTISNLSNIGDCSDRSSDKHAEQSERNGPSEQREQKKKNVLSPSIFQQIHVSSQQVTVSFIEN